MTASGVCKGISLCVLNIFSFHGSSKCSRSAMFGASLTSCISSSGSYVLDYANELNTD